MISTGERKPFSNINVVALLLPGFVVEQHC